MATTTDRWAEPQQVSDVEIAFGGDMENLLPPMGDIPDAFKGRSTIWNRLQAKWFFSGIDDLSVFEANDGIDRDAALRHLAAIQGSWAPKHEHKAAAVSWLMSRWFKKTDALTAMLSG